MDQEREADEALSVDGTVRYFPPPVEPLEAGRGLPSVSTKMMSLAYGRVFSGPSILTRSPSLVIAPVEHTSMHLLHPSCAERLWAQMRSL